MASRFEGSRPIWTSPLGKAKLESFKGPATI